MINKIVLTGLLFNITQSILSQTGEIPISNKEIIAGRNYLKNQDIKGHQYTFPCPIYHWEIDTANYRITLLLRYLRNDGKYYKNKGFLMVYDLKDHRSLWHCKKYSFDIYQKKDILIETPNYKTSRINYHNGNVLWTSEYEIFFVDTLSNVGLAYYTGPSAKPDIILNGINMTNGSVKWKRKVNREFGWNAIHYLDDSVILIVSSGLHSINPTNGYGWDYNAITGIKDYTSAVATTAAGAALGLLTGTFVYNTHPDIIRNIVSNVILKRSKIYFASKEKVVCLDYDGKIIWETSLPEKVVSKSTLFIRDSILYMINYGYAFMGNRKIDYGKPFISSYLINDGKQKYSVEFLDKAGISSFNTQKDTILLIFMNKIYKILLTDGSEVLERKMDENKFGELQYFVGGQFYVQSSDSSFVSIKLSDTTKYYIAAIPDKILTFNRQLEIEHQMNFDDVWINYASYYNYKLLTDENETVILDQNNTVVADIKVSGSTFLIGTTIYIIQNENLTEIDLGDLQ